MYVEYSDKNNIIYILQIYTFAGVVKAYDKTFYRYYWYTREPKTLMKGAVL